MNIFISWSGEKSRIVAQALKAFLQDVNQRIIAWFSEEDITAGQRWGNELASQLDSTNYGIICVTQESLQSQWLVFEAGALSKSVKVGKVCPYLIDLDRKQLSGPLSQFQAKEASKEHTWQMLQSINLSMGNDALPEERLKKYFEAFWPGLFDVITKVNNELKFIPKSLRDELLQVLPHLYNLTNKMSHLVEMADIPSYSINFSQAPIYAWHELIQIAVKEKKLGALMEIVEQEYEMNEVVRQLRRKVSEWELQKL